MVEDSPQRAIVVFPPREDVAAVDDLRDRFDPLASNVAPHLTLVFPFADPITPAQLRAHVESCVEGLPCFPLELRDVTGSEREYLFLNVKRGNDELVELHDRLYTGPLARHRSFADTFVPHLTVGRVPFSSFRTAVERASQTQIHIRTVCNAVTIYRIFDDGRRENESVVALR